MNKSIDFQALAHKTFNDACAEAITIDYKPEFSNGTGYLDGAVDLVKGEIGKRYTFCTDNGRQALVLVTRLGNFVLFERYTDTSTFLTFNCDQRLKKTSIVQLEGKVGYDAIGCLIGHDDLSDQVERAYKVFKSL